MMPRAKLLVYVVINGEFIYDEQIIELEENLLNNIQIETPLKAPPGQDIDITISSKPYNYIGLMVVDQNAINIRKGMYSYTTFQMFLFFLANFDCFIFF